MYVSVGICIGTFAYLGTCHVYGQHEFGSHLPTHVDLAPNPYFISMCEQSSLHLYVLTHRESLFSYCKQYHCAWFLHGSYYPKI